MTIYVGPHHVVGDLAGEIARLESLLVDLERLGNGERPSQEELDASRLLDNYIISLASRPCLIGENHGHPILKGRLIQTSDLCVAALDRSWARTMSRFYRLGSPAKRETQHGR